MMINWRNEEALYQPVAIRRALFCPSIRRSIIAKGREPITDLRMKPEKKNVIMI